MKLYSRFNVEGALKMLKKGDVISYGTTGVCKVEGECEQTVKGQKKRYIVLKPVHQINSTLYVPVDNDELRTKFKPLLTGDADAAGFCRFFDCHSHFDCVHSAVLLS